MGPASTLRRCSFGRRAGRAADQRSADYYGKVNYLPEWWSFFTTWGGWLPVLFVWRTPARGTMPFITCCRWSRARCWITVRVEMDANKLEFPSVTPRVPAAVIAPCWPVMDYQQRHTDAETTTVVNDWVTRKNNDEFMIGAPYFDEPGTSVRRWRNGCRRRTTACSNRVVWKLAETGPRLHMDQINARLRPAPPTPLPWEARWAFRCRSVHRRSALFCWR